MSEWIALASFLITQLLALGVFLARLHSKIEVHDAQIRFALELLTEIRDAIRSSAAGSRR